MEERIYGSRSYMDDKKDNTVKKVHKVNMTGRSAMQLTGVNDVMSFDANEVLLDTDMGVLMVRGENLHINRLSLDKGETDIDGRIDGLIYSEQTAKNGKNGSMLSRLFG